MTELSQQTNMQELSVSGLSSALKRLVEDGFPYVRVRGEISGFRGVQASGHCYFALKDQAAKIDVVIWKGVLQRLRFKPEEGMEVVATGKVSTFAGKSTYQLIVESLAPAGTGALMLLLEERRKKLAAEGLFAQGRKQRLPFLPRRIGVITSADGAVIRDILHRIRDRFPVDVLLWPVRVQGESSVSEIIAAVRGLNDLPRTGTPSRPDVLIIARGGGSIEDLWGFNDEALVRTAAESVTPIISAIGHETDWTLLDHAADMRAPTPTAAAEMAVPVRADLLATLMGVAGRQSAAVAWALANKRNTLRAQTRALPSAADISAAARQGIDLFAARLRHAIELILRQREQLGGRLGGRMVARSPAVIVANTRTRLERASHNLDSAARGSAAVRSSRFVESRARFAQIRQTLVHGVRRFAVRLDDLGARSRLLRRIDMEKKVSRLRGVSLVLEALGHRQVLARGFALIRDERGALVLGLQPARTADALDIEFHDGTLRVVPASPSAPNPRRAVKARKAAARSAPTLFDPPRR
jgi:exodeoxyribonuclease VII large subunit